MEGAASRCYAPFSAGKNAVLGHFWWGKHGSTHTAPETYAGDTVWEMKGLSNVETDPERYQMAIN
jgi:hypothetical protein